MGQPFKILTSAAWLILWALAVQSASAQNRYPAIEEAWDGTDYRAVVQRVQKDGLALPTLADAATKPVFERMVDADNIPLRMGLNTKLSATIRFQRLDSALDPIHKLVILYSNEMQKGKPYSAELARLMIYESKVSGALLELSEPVLSGLANDKRYQTHVENHNLIKNNARQLYSWMVKGMTEPNIYSKPDILKMVRGALDGLPAYLPILTDQDRQGLTQKLTQQISATTDQELKTALTELRDAIEHRRVRT
jgi:hypothetical protein